MATTLEALEERLAALEREMRSLRQWVQARLKEEALPGAGAGAAQAELAAGWARAMEQLGVRGEPIPAERLQEMIAAGLKKIEEASGQG
jgi:hypothetical protein